jgi:hypothetical protein
MAYAASRGRDAVAADIAAYAMKDPTFWDPSVASAIPLEETE